MTGWSDNFSTVNGVPIHYLRSGGQHPTLLVLHGFTDSARNCEVFARAFTADYDVILVDERGHGLSGAAPASYSLAEQADDMAAFITGLGLDKPAIYGHSIGAVTAIQTAFQYPDLLSCVILEDPPLQNNISLPIDHSGWKTSLTAFKQRPYEEQLAEALRNHGHWGQEENEAWVESKQQFDLVLFDSPLINRFLDWRHMAPRLTIPGLLIIGDSDLGAIVTQEVAREFQALWKTLEVSHIEKAGHSIRRDQPAAVREITKQYLREHLS